MRVTQGRAHQGPGAVICGDTPRLERITLAPQTTAPSTSSFGVFVPVLHAIAELIVSCDISPILTDCINTDSSHQLLLPTAIMPSPMSILYYAVHPSELRSIIQWYVAQSTQRYRRHLGVCAGVGMLLTSS